MYPQPFYVTWTILFCFLWPFIAIPMLPRRASSSAPVAAILVPLALVTAVVWIGLANAFQGLDVSGSGRSVLAAGMAEALVRWFVWLFALLVIAVAALIRRTRPAVDAMTAVIAVVLLIEIGGALRFAAAPINSLTLVYAAIGAALAAAFVSAVWLFLVSRGRAVVTLPAGLTIAVIAYVVMAFFVWQHAERYRQIAMHG